jgi:hypothetical protein
MDLREISSLGKLPGVKVAHSNETSFPPDPCVRAARTDHRGIRPGVDREDAVRNSGGEVHRATVDAEGPSSEPEEVDQLRKTGLPEQIHHILRPLNLDRAARDAHEKDGVRGEMFTKLANLGNREAFSLTP